ncbi:hypothetical protein FVE85_3593 [Porphyridium purpureum]|uniref:Uncharacterized protein n=1 Tax=Porphyridium purpureum TaxID=35688 RepID=A0A5J4YLX7_PORPP|nr:hypothetical protein FVE85_3593 [Porphyridium purpureum]|eukprot:POR1141..scf249_10
MLGRCLGRGHYWHVDVLRGVLDTPHWIHTSAVTLNQPRVRIKLNPDDFPKLERENDNPYHELTLEEKRARVRTEDYDLGKLKLVNKFYAIRKGKHSFRGVVFTAKEYGSLVLGIKNFKGERVDHGLDRAIDYCMSERFKNQKRYPAPQFDAFRYGVNGARGIVVKPNCFQHVLARAVSPHTEIESFPTATQALVYCVQAGTPYTDWEALDSSLVFMSYMHLQTPILWSKYLIMYANSELPTGPLCHPDPPTDSSTVQRPKKKQPAVLEIPFVGHVPEGSDSSSGIFPLADQVEE